MHTFNGAYTEDHLDRIAFPLGGLGAGMICIEGTGAFSHASLAHKPEMFNEPMIFGALHTRQAGQRAGRVLEGRVPMWKVFGPSGAGNGGAGRHYGFPRFAQSVFEARVPFARIDLADADVPLDVSLTGWSPFVPGDADASSLPVAAVEYRFSNSTDAVVDAVFSFHARHFMTDWQGGHRVAAAAGGFTLAQAAVPERQVRESAFCVSVREPEATVDCCWFRGGWFDSQTRLWKAIEQGQVVGNDPVVEGAPAAGGSVYIPFSLAPGEVRCIPVLLSWYVPHSGLRTGTDPAPVPEDAAETYRPWYAGRFESVDAVNAAWRDDYESLRSRTETFTDCLYDTTLPPAVMEAVTANLTILKSPTVLRQHDGRVWAWEGCCDCAGCCAGTCTHVWNYAQAMPHLFPALERGLRETEFNESQDETGHQMFRASLPIRACAHDRLAAADGQLGGIMKVHRDWRISGDGDWLRRLWPRVRSSLDYCIRTWDPDQRGALFEPHHNTYDIEFWGADGMCTSFYLGALRAAVEMGTALNEDVDAYRVLLERGIAVMRDDLFDGEYFIQKIQWQGLHADDPVAEARKAVCAMDYSPEALALLEQEGPKYQYGAGCLSDGVLGCWLAAVCGVPAFLDDERVRSHLLAVHRYNLKQDLFTHPNPQRPTYALNGEGGLLLCTWPKGGALTLPFVYSNEVWTGIEYQVASHLIMLGCVEQGLEIVRAARSRYDGRIRNPFNEYECGHWYARAMASYGLLQALSGARYDAVDRVLYLEPSIEGDFRCFLATAGGYGTVGVRQGQPFLDVRSGSIPCERIAYRVFGHETS